MPKAEVKVHCKHWKRDPKRKHKNGGLCGAGKYGTSINAGICEMMCKPGCVEVIELNDDGSIKKRGVPSVPKMAGNLAQSLAGAVMNAVRGKKVVAPPDVREKRIEICQTRCLKWEGNRCTVCGCALPKKVVLANSKCPLEEPKWNEYLSEEDNGLPRD